MSDLSEILFHLENRMKNKLQQNEIPLSENKLIIPTKPFGELHLRDSDEFVPFVQEHNEIIDNQKEVKALPIKEFKVSSSSNDQQSSKENESTFAEKIKERNLNQSISKGNSHLNLTNDKIRQNESINAQNTNKSLKKRKHSNIEKSDRSDDAHNTLKKTKISYKQQTLNTNKTDEKVDNLRKYPSENSFNSSDEQNNNGFIAQKGFEQSQIAPIGSNKKISDFFGNRNYSGEEIMAKKLVISSNKKAANKSLNSNCFLYNKSFLNEIPEEQAINESWKFEKKLLIAKIKEIEQKYEHEKKEKDNLNLQFEKNIKAVSDNRMQYQTGVQSLFTKLVLDNENMRRKEHKVYLQQQKQRLGEYISQRYLIYVLMIKNY